MYGAQPIGRYGQRGSQLHDNCLKTLFSSVSSGPKASQPSPMATARENTPRPCQPGSNLLCPPESSLVLRTFYRRSQSLSNSTLTVASNPSLSIALTMRF